MGQQEGEAFSLGMNRVQFLKFSWWKRIQGLNIMQFTHLYRRFNFRLALGIFSLFILYCFYPTSQPDESKAYYLTALDLIGLPEDDEKLIAYTKRFVVPPSKLPYNLTDPNAVDYSEFDTSTTVINLLKNKTNGFFVECGALTGEAISTTLMLEKQYGWTGLLVEGAPKNVEELLKKQRKAWIAPGCMSIKKEAAFVSFLDNWVYGKVKNGKNEIGNTSTTVFCIPFNTIMTAIGVKKIDYFSLDVEGDEFDILKTIDFGNIEIDLMTVEHLHNVEFHDQMIQFMEANNFKMYTKARNDFYFVHQRLSHLM